MSKILYPIVYGFCYLISLLPLRVLYCISDVLYLLLYKLIGYRRRVVRNNLSTSFPEKDEKERRTIEKKFYHFFSYRFLYSFSPVITVHYKIRF